MKTMRTVLVVLALCALLTVSALAAEGFNAKLDVKTTDTTITVTVQDSEVLQTLKPALTVPCDFVNAKVTFEGREVEAVLKNGEITFSVTKGGQYVITKTADPESGDSGSDGGGAEPDLPAVPSQPAAPSGPNAGTSAITRPDGTVIETETKKDGTVIKTTTKPSGQISATVTLPKGVKETTVTIPVKNPTPGLVAVIQHPDGTEEVIRTSAVGKEGVTVILSGSAILKVEDRSMLFSDVKPTDWEKGAVDFVSARGLFSGTGGSTFSPDASMTRGMILTVLARLDGQSTEAAAGEKWYEPGVNWSVASRLSDGTNPEGKVTREQLAVMLWRYAGSPKGTGSLIRFVDGSDVSSWAIEALRWAVAEGVINGNTDGTLKPQGNATRAQVSQMLMNFVNCMA